MTDLGGMPADFAISRLKGARRGVSYLDEGFASLVEGLSGITDDQIVAERFLAVHVVTHVLPGPEDGLAGPQSRCPDPRGCTWQATGWGRRGWLSDAAIASGQHAGMLAAGAPAEDRTYPRVA